MFITLRCFLFYQKKSFYTYKNILYPMFTPSNIKIYIKTHFIYIFFNFFIFYFFIQAKYKLFE